MTTQSTYRSFRQLLAASWDATRDERVRFYAFILLYVLAYSVDLLVPWAVGYIIGVFVEHGFSPYAYEQCLYGIGGYVLLRVIYTVCHHYGRYLQAIVAYSSRMRKLNELFGAYLGFPMPWHVEHHSGENLSRMHRSVGAIDSTIGTYVWQIIEGLTKIILASAAILTLDIWVAINVTAMSLVTIAIMVLFNKQLIRNVRLNNAFHDRLNRIGVDYLFNIITVKMLRLERIGRAGLRNLQPDGLAISKRIARYTELKWGSISFGYAVVMGTSLLIYFHGHRGFSGALDVAQVYVLMSYLDKIFQAIGSFTGYYGGLLEAATAYEDGARVLNEAGTLDTRTVATPLAAGWGKVEVTGLDFAYANRGSSALRQVEISFTRGEKIALVGASGSGKSTLLKLLGGMLMPTSSVVSVDGTSSAIESIAQSSLLLPQEPEVFSETVRFNLTMGELFSDEQINFVEKVCRIEQVIAKLPLGWESNLAEKGLNLSVGEKQRVAMARGLLRAHDKDLLLLDEPTSSLDPKTEKEIFLSIFESFQGKTVITACHRLALVPLFDTIMFVRLGKVEEVGSFEQLLQRRGRFFEAWEDYLKTRTPENDNGGADEA